MRWTSENTETLKTLWTEGLSASQIASRIGGVTRNAVIGKIHRIGLGGQRSKSHGRAIVRARASRPPRKQPRAADQPLRIADLAPPIADLPPLGEAPSSPVTVLTLTRGLCHWPEGDPRDPAFHFCGRASRSGSYCEHHARRAHRPPSAEDDVHACVRHRRPALESSRPARPAPESETADGGT